MKADIFHRLLAVRQARASCALVTRIADGCQSVVAGGICTGDLALTPAQLEEIAARLLADRSGRLDSDPTLFARVYALPFRLLVVGAVHITQFLAPMAAMAGFEVTVIDPRSAFANADRFPGVALTDEWPDEAMARLAPDAQTAVVTLAHDPKLDDPALLAALASPAFYIGALGSRRTHAQRSARLIEQGAGERISRIHAPIGLDLGGRSPAEIAVAVLAQIVQVKYRAGS
ncbi:MAG TPA: XdhC family protein [Rhodocyclaceae bacterium]|nr:XdhC family protein [Rhodocyclaceae bacterium]